MNDLQKQTLDFGKASLVAAVEMMTATAEGAKRLHDHQLAMITQTLQDKAGLSDQINDAKSREHLIALCATLAGNQFKYATAYWSGMHRVVSESQAALQKLGQTQSMEMQRHLATSLEVAVNGGPEPVVEAVKATVTAISVGLSTLARATAESMRLAETQSLVANGRSHPFESKAVRAGR